TEECLDTDYQSAIWIWRQRFEQNHHRGWRWQSCDADHNKRLPVSEGRLTNSLGGSLMGRGKGGDDWGTFFLILLGVGVGAITLYYTKAGRGEENDAALLPNNLEGGIDFVVAKLNKKF